MFGVRARSELDGHAGPGSTHTPIVVAHATLLPGSRVTIPWRPDFNALAYVLSGHGSAGIEAAPIQNGQLAVFGAGDVLALGALFEARRRGLRVPDDLALASFDDHEACRVTNPPLTALAIPRYEIGRRCARLITESGPGPKVEATAVQDLGFSLVARESTGCSTVLR